MPSTRARLLTSAACTIGLMLNAIAVPVYANPEGGRIVVGEATIAQPNATTVAINQTSDKAIIDWRSFNVTPAELVQFNQPGVRSITLNRVTGGDPSAILGTIKANGQVWLINPNGIAFGRSAKVDVAGLLATTLNIDNADFMAGRYRFVDSGGVPASVTNAGTLTISGAGLAALVAPTVANSGVIQARLGHIDLASTHGFTLDFYGDGRINFLLNKDTSTALANSLGAPTVSNSGALIADGGSILLTADTAKAVVDQTINMNGYIQARTVGARNGVVILDGGAGAVAVLGTIDTTGAQGGKIAITGGAVHLGTTVLLDASGDTGGGIVLVGGDAHGMGELANAQTTSVADGARIRVNSLYFGDAGRAIIWSNDRTDFAGMIDATAGRDGGNGGFAEVSGHNLLNFTGLVDLRAANGTLGTLLLDPRNVTISASGGTAPTLPSSGPTTLNAAADDSILQVATLLSALGLGNVIITTGSSGTQAGDITVASNVSWSNASNLTLLANRNVVVNDGVTVANTGAGNLVLHADSTGSGTGTVTFNGTGKVNYAGSTGTVSIFYNPSDNPLGSVVNPNSYKTVSQFPNNVITNSGKAEQLINYMLVNTSFDLQNIQNKIDGTFAIGRDIDLSATKNWNSGAGFYPIASPLNNVDREFIGILDGQGKTLSNLFISPSSGGRLGLFSWLGSSSIVRNISLSGEIVSSSPSGNAIGMLSGFAFGLIDSVHTSGKITTTNGGAQAGGIAALNGGQITNSSASVSINLNGSGGAGGIAAKNQGPSQLSLSGRNTGLKGGLIDRSWSSGSVSLVGGSSTAGGVAGLSDGVISNAFSTGSVSIRTSTGVGEFAGGLVGILTEAGGGNGQPFIKGSIINSYSVGLVSSASPGGLVSQSIDAIFAQPQIANASNAYWDTQTSGTSVSAAGMGLTTSQLKSGLPSGFDPAIWALDPAVNNGYPYLRSQTASAVSPQSVSFGIATPPVVTPPVTPPVVAPPVVTPPIVAPPVVAPPVVTPPIVTPPVVAPPVVTPPAAMPPVTPPPVVIPPVVTTPLAPPAVGTNQFLNQYLNVASGFGRTSNTTPAYGIFTADGGVRYIGQNGVQVSYQSGIQTIYITEFTVASSKIVALAYQCITSGCTSVVISHVLDTLIGSTLQRMGISSDINSLPDGYRIVAPWIPFEIFFRPIPAGG